MEQVVIEHVLGSWTVEVLTNCTDIPEGCKDWDSFGRGFKYKGHAVAYLKRMAKHSPDHGSRWVIYEFQQRWFVAMRVK